MTVWQERTTDDSKESECLKELLSARTQEYIEEILQPHFGGMITFVKDCEVAIERGHTEHLSAQESMSFIFSAQSTIHCVSEKTRKLWNVIAQHYKNQFWQHLAEIFKRLQNRVCMFQFLCRFAFSINFSSFKPDTKNNANFDAVDYQANTPTLMRCNFFYKTYT